MSCNRRDLFDYVGDTYAPNEILKIRLIDAN